MFDFCKPTVRALSLCCIVQVLDVSDSDRLNHIAKPYISCSL
jgi:hypothetical protein